MATMNDKLKGTFNVQARSQARRLPAGCRRSGSGVPTGFIRLNPTESECSIFFKAKIRSHESDFLTTDGHR